LITVIWYLADDPFSSSPVGYPLPALPDGVSLQNPTLVVNDGYVSVGLDLAFAGVPAGTSAKININNSI